MASRYFSLQEKFSELETMVEQKKEEIETIKSESKKIEGFRKEIKNFIQASHRGMKGNQADGLVKESWIAYLEGELVDEQERQKLWRLQLADLENQKRMLQMDLQLKELEKKKEKSVTVEDLQRVLQDNQEKKKVLSRRIVETEKRIGEYPQKTRKIKQEKESFGYKIQDLEKRKNLKDRENMNLRDKKTLKKRRMENAFLEKKSEKIAVEKRVRAQEKEYKVLDETLQASLNYQEEERVIVQEMVNLDKQNLKLKEKIAELETLIRELEDGLQ